MWIFALAGIFLIVALVFVVRYFLGGRKPAEKENVKLEGHSDITVSIESENKNGISKKRKKDFIFAMVFMALCEICILLGNFINHI